MQKASELERAEKLFEREGYTLWATDNPSLAMLEWETESLGRLAGQLFEVLKQHALPMNVVERVGEQVMVIRRMEPVGLYVMGRATPHDASAEFFSWKDEPLDAHHAAQVRYGSKSLVSYMQDSAVHAARTVRARLHLEEGQEIQIRVEFGHSTETDCCMQVVNPVHCRFPTSDYEALAAQLGGTTP